ncbi:hypothetical protein R6Q59_009538 [Mikania micrantha]
MSSTQGQTIRCKAAVAWEAGKPLVIEEVEVAPPQKMEVRVKILFTSLCHTDVYFWEAKGQNPVFPRILGHEAGGVVESVGEGVTDLQPGDHVLPVFTGECKECDHCKSEESNMCDLLRINTDRGVMIHDQTSRFSINGKPIFHFVGTSTFSEYTVIHVGCLAKINPLAPLDKVCVLSCGISTGLGATLNVAKPKKGSSVAVFGLGAVGLAAAEGARIAGASRIIGVDLNANRFELAKQFGVTEFVNPKDYKKPVQEVIAEMTNGGVDRSVECTGHIDAMISAFECVHDGWGVAVLVGVPHKDAVFKTSPLNLLNERTLKGTFFGNYKPRSDIPSVVEQYMNKKLELEKFITHEVPFSEINKAFDLMLKDTFTNYNNAHNGNPKGPCDQFPRPHPHAKPSQPNRNPPSLLPCRTGPYVGHFRMRSGCRRSKSYKESRKSSFKDPGAYVPAEENKQEKATPSNKLPAMYVSNPSQVTTYVSETKPAVNGILRPVILVAMASLVTNTLTWMLKENRSRDLNGTWRPMGETLVSPPTSQVEPPPLLLWIYLPHHLVPHLDLWEKPNQVENRVIQMNNIEESEAEDGFIPDSFVCIKMRLVERRIYIPDFHPIAP